MVRSKIVQILFHPLVWDGKTLFDLRPKMNLQSIWTKYFILCSQNKSICHIIPFIKIYRLSKSKNLTWLVMIWGEYIWWLSCHLIVRGGHHPAALQAVLYPINTGCKTLVTLPAIILNKSSHTQYNTDQSVAVIGDVHLSCQGAKICHSYVTYITLYLFNIFKDIL